MKQADYLQSLGKESQRCLLQFHEKSLYFDVCKLDYLNLFFQTNNNNNKKRFISSDGRGGGASKGLRNVFILNIPKSFKNIYIYFHTIQNPGVKLLKEA